MTPGTATTPEPPRIGTSNRAVSLNPKPKKVSFVKQAPLSAPGNGKGQGTTKTGDALIGDNRKRFSCTICEGPHSNLVFCPRLPMYIPSGKGSVTLPRGICKYCLYTGFKDASNCRHNAVHSWRRSYCTAGDMHYMLCPTCPRHQLAQSWWKQHHNPQMGFKNYTQIVNDLTFNNVQAGINVISVSDTEDDMSSGTDKVCELSQVEAQILSNEALPPVRTNDIPVGGMTIPSEMVKVRYKDRDTLIQVFYDKGSQLSLVNKYCTPLIIDSRKSEKPICLGTIDDKTSDIRSIENLYLGEGW